MKIINRTVWILSIVSMFADIASEMLYPVVPVYLKEIGFSIFLIGVLEGVANFTAGLSMGYFGKRSDEKGLRLPFIKWGYFLSAISKPMLGAFINPVWVFFARTTERLGKGLRTAPRDALLSQNATILTKARVFGFHRSMDTLGAVIGPLTALVFLHFFPKQYTSLFFLAIFPGMIAVALIFLLKENRQPSTTIRKGNFFSFLKFWKISSPQYKKLVIGLSLFALFNSSDIFLLLKTKEISGSDELTIITYVFYNLIYVIASYPLGVLADRFGLKTIFCFGLILFALVYLLFAFSNSTMMVFIGFFIYGVYAAATEGIAKAWITNLTHEINTGTALGFYTSCQSICSLIASVLAGFLWTTFSSTATFTISAVAALSVFLYMQTFTKKL